MKILAGDFKVSEYAATHDAFVFGTREKGERILFSEIESLDVDSEEEKTRGGLGMAAAGGFVFGGAGAVTGAILGRKKNKESVVSIRFLDGRRLMALLPHADVVRIRAAMFDVDPQRDNEDRRHDMRRRLRLEAEARKQKRQEAMIGGAIMLALLILLAMWAVPKLQRGETLITPPIQSVAQIEDEKQERVTLD